MSDLEKRINALSGVEKQLTVKGMSKGKVHWMTNIMVDIYKNTNDASRTLLCDIMMLNILNRLLKILKKNNNFYYDEDYKKLNSMHWGLNNNENVSSLL